jgi:hypothetical protein
MASYENNKQKIRSWHVFRMSSVYPCVMYTCNNNLNCCDNYIVLIVFNSVSGNNQIGFDLPVDNLKTGKVKNTFPTTYGELNIFQQSTIKHCVFIILTIYIQAVITNNKR